MGVSSVTLHWNGATGGRSKKGKRTYVAVYKVITTSAQDGPGIIQDHFYNNFGSLPYPEVSHYAYGNDIDIFAFCTDLDCERDTASQTIWQVTASFSTPDPEEQEDEVDKKGEKAKHPLDRIPAIQFGFAQYQVPVTNAEKIKGFNGQALKDWPKGFKGVPVNSCGDEYNPPLVKDEARLVVRINFNAADFPKNHAENGLNKVNNDNFVIKAVENVGEQFFKKGTCLLKQVGGSLQFERDRVGRVHFFYAVSIEWHVNKEGWNVEVPDRGLNARKKHGDPDGEGGEVTETEIEVGMPGCARITDIKGNPISTPVLLDGDGQPNDRIQPHYVEWKIYEDFAFKGLFQGIRGNPLGDERK